ncbi:MAG: PAS domain S-box protein, partial [Candidatus Deferrimicrobiota bacterium]
EILGAIAKAIAVEEERKRATEALRASKETLGTLIQASPLAIVTFDSDGIIRTWNPAAERMFGWKEEEAVGKPHPIVPEDKQEEFRSLRAIALRGETFTNIEVRRRRKDGTQIDLSISTGPLHDAGGAVTSIMSIITDITSRRSTEEALRQSEEQLRQAQKMEAVGRLAGGIAHDFNNLLTAVTGYSELLQERIGDQDPMWRELEEIRRAGVRAASLTRQLLAFSRRQVLQTKVLDLNWIVTGLETMLRRLIGEDVELVTKLGGDPVRLKADPGQIEQVVMNLVVNSREAMPQGGRLVIGTASVNLGKREADRLGLAEPGIYAILAVSDTGAGMSEEVKSHLFEPFFTTKAEGTGLGLATVYGIVQQSGGGIRVDSEIDKGTTIKIYFPSVDELVEAAEGAGAVPAVVSGGLETVLVAEDEDMVRDLVCEILQRNGYIVLEARSGNEALLISGRHHGPIHLLLTDIVMPRMRGTALAERLALLRPEMKVLYMSGYTDDATFNNGDAGKGTAFIQKPFGPSTLANKVREVLDSGRKELSG